MMRLFQHLLRSLTLLTLLLAGQSAQAAHATENPQQHLAVQPRLRPMPLAAVRITGGLFHHAQEMNRRWLTSMDPNRYLSGFRTEAGLTSEVPRYGGWENSGCSGHAFGHYLSAASMMYASTGDTVLLNKIAYSIDALDGCQQHEGTGLLAGHERSRALFEELRRGDIRSQGFDLNGGWVPFYTMHKVIAGLVDVCCHTPIEKARTVMIRLVDWLDELVGHLDEEQMRQILICEHGGMTEALANVYLLTGEERYLRLARRFDHEWLLQPLAAGQDSLAGKHGNTQIPKIVGAAREYGCTGEERYWQIADFFWHRVVEHHSYVIGGNGEHEHFGAPDMLADRLSEGTCETCNTYNMLKLTKQLYQYDPTVKRMDYYERALYNQILASQNPADGMVCYMSPLHSGGRKGYSLPFDSFWCCVGTGMENHARYGESIYFTDRQENLYVNLFIPSTLRWAERKTQVEQITQFPYDDVVTLRISPEQATRFTLHLRYPSWAAPDAEVTINGKRAMHRATPGSYIALRRKWQAGDEVQITLRRTVYSEHLAGDPVHRAYLYGPIVLATALDDHAPIPVVKSVNPAHHHEQVAGSDLARLRFTLPLTEQESVELLPYYELGSRRMALYFRHFSPEHWEEQLAEFRLREQRDAWLQQHTIAQITLGEMQPERDHCFESTHSEPLEWQGRKYRISRGGWMAFDMEVDPERSNTLYATYWGNQFYNHSFDIEVDGVKIGFENIHNWGHQYVEQAYLIPEELTRGKKQVRITFRAVRPDAVAGPLFDCRMMH